MNNEETEEEREAYRRGYMDKAKAEDDHRKYNRECMLNMLDNLGYPTVEEEVTAFGKTYNYRKVGDSLQWRIRCGQIPKSYQECVAALLECLIDQGGINAWDGDGVGCAAQMMWELAKLQNP